VDRGEGKGKKGEWKREEGRGKREEIYPKMEYRESGGVRGGRVLCVHDYTISLVLQTSLSLSLFPFPSPSPTPPPKRPNAISEPE